MSQAEFGRRRPVREEPAIITESEAPHPLKELVSRIHPVKVAYGVGFIFLGYILGRVAISGLLPEPEFYRVVIEHPRLFEELPDGTTREIFVEPKPRPAS